jgi:hypothetical protein
MLQPLCEQSPDRLASPMSPLAQVVLGTLSVLAHWALRAAVITWRIVVTLLGALVLAAVLIVLGNLAFHSYRDVPYRALSMDAPACQEGAEQGWDVLASTNNKQIANDEISAIAKNDLHWRTKFACVRQHHIVPGYRAADGNVRSLDYELAFIEFREDGKPYAIREPCDPKVSKTCVDEGYGPVKFSNKSQLDAVLEALSDDTYYVMVFVHGWRNDASIGNRNVADFRHYAAHAARFLEDRSAIDPRGMTPHVIAIFIGWRGARTDENWLHQKLGMFGDAIGTFLAVLTLFDRKPVSEAIAPSVLTALRDIEAKLGIAHEIPSIDYTPDNKNKMIVFGHSLGGDLLITALRDDLVKRVHEHTPTKYMQPVLGDLVVLINPAAEASKWIDVQRALWEKLALIYADRRPPSEYADAHKFFSVIQAPIIVSATAARDWPPGGLAEIDCKRQGTDARTAQIKHVVSKEGWDYDWATYDLFPFFKGDFRPMADTLERIAFRRDPHDACDDTSVSLARRVVMSPLYGLSLFLRVFPFMHSDPGESHTLGHVDPPRGPTAAFSNFSGRPFGTTHEIVGLAPAVDRSKRKRDSEGVREIPVGYDEVILSQADCPVAKAWLLHAREKTISDDSPNGLNWDSERAGEDAPALRFRHGFRRGGISPITRANDPFWNMRAFDTALVRHDGYMLSSFICAMNQLVMDDPGGLSLQKAGAAAGTIPRERPSEQP